ncbi:MAG: hypothetical protein KDB14_07425 [Planctomycetales bacterium]|nr:hypothetical protein [Planctomycetales bacterium]
MTFRRRRNPLLIPVAVPVCALLLFAVGAGALSGQDLRSKEQAQEKARAMAAQLVTGVLDIQLRQLEENGLQQAEIYRDIRAMRENLDALVDGEMQEIVGLLVTAQEGTVDQRRETFQQVRPAIREVVVRLLAERQRLQKRLKTARLAAEVQRLLERQSNVYEDTGASMELPTGVRDRRALELAEDQRDVTAVYYQMLGLLEEMRSWSGPVGVGAGRGMTLLRTANVEPELKGAATALENAGFSDALTSERKVIRALQALLEQIDAARGMVSSDRAELIRQVEQLMREQEETRAETVAADLQDSRQRDALEDRQRRVHRALGELTDMVMAVTKSDPILLEQAKQAALEGVDALFAGDADQANREQSKVVGNLAQLREELLKLAGADRAERSSDELLAEELALEKAERTLNDAAAKENAAAAALESNPAAAAAQEKAAAERLDAAEKQLDPSDVSARIQEAKTAAEQAEAALRDEETDVAERRGAVNNAKEALEAAQSQLAVRKDDVKRHRMAVEVGELARAAETLERAAAAQRRALQKLADSKEAAADNPAKLNAAELHELAEQQQQVREIAEDIAKGVRRTAPNALDELSAAQAEARRAERPLREMTDGNDKPATQDAAQQALEKSANQLEQAAAEIRKRQAETAEQLANEAGKQLSKVSPVRAAAQAQLDKTQQATSPEELLQRALNEVRRAEEKQLEAEGRQQLAAAQRRQDRIAELKQAQANAERAADDYAKGKVNSPLEASARQKQVADLAKKLADAIEQQRNDRDDNLDADLDSEAAGAEAAQLKRVARQAEEAARSALLDSPAKMKEAQTRVAQALEDATQRTASQVEATTNAEPGQPNADAQQQVADAASRAGRQVEQTPNSEPARAALAKAQQAAEGARQQLQAGDPDAAKQAQQQTKSFLADAKDALQQSLAQVRNEQRKEQADLAAESRKLAQSAAGLDPAAARALRQAAQQAQRAADGDPEEHPAAPADDASESKPGEAAEGDPTAPASGEATPGQQRSLERAVASLAAREQQIRRDFDIAAALSDLARDQQQARDEIADKAKQLNELSQRAADAKEKGEADPHLADRREAARSLEEATRQFAAAAQATGQGAVQISGQAEVVNEPIRRGLEKASELPQNEPLRPEGKMQPAPNQEGADAQQAAAAKGDANSNAQTAEAAPANSNPPGENGQEASTEEGGQASEAGPGEPGQSENQAEGQSGAGQGQQSGEAQNQVGSGPQELGTSLVPPSAQATANQIAGNQALQQAKEALESQPPGEGTAADGSTSSPGAETRSSESSPDKNDEQPAADSAVGSERATATDNEDRNIEMRQVEGEPWFAKLPPALQQAIRARARQSAPRGYEERLRRYFERGQ